MKGALELFTQTVQMAKIHYCGPSQRSVKEAHIRVHSKEHISYMYN